MHCFSKVKVLHLFKFPTVLKLSSKRLPLTQCECNLCYTHCSGRYILSIQCCIGVLGGQLSIQAEYTTHGHMDLHFVADSKWMELLQQMGSSRLGLRPEDQLLDHIHRIIQLMNCILHCQKHFSGLPPQAILKQAVTDRLVSAVEAAAYTPAQTASMKLPPAQAASAETWPAVQDLARQGMRLYHGLQKGSLAGHPIKFSNAAKLLMFDVFEVLSALLLGETPSKKPFILYRPPQSHDKQARHWHANNTLLTVPQCQDS